MSIVKYTNSKTGVTYAYESTGKWNPVTQRNEPVRTYLGRVDPESGEITPTGGKRGRKRKADLPDGDSVSMPVKVTPEQYMNVVSTLEQTQAMLNEQQARLHQIEEENYMLKRVLHDIALKAAQYAGDSI